MPSRVPHQLLEITLISGQDLARASKSMRTFAVVWIHPEHKLTTRIDTEGDTNPVWNEKFVFRVDDEFLNADTSAVMIEVYASAWLRDVLIGSAAVVVNNLAPSSRSVEKSKMRFTELQLRRPSGRPRGIVNVGVTLLDSSMRSLPLYSELSNSAVGYWDPMDAKMQIKRGKDEHRYYNIELTRSQSDRTETSYLEKGVGSVCSESIISASDFGILPKGVYGNGSLCSDVGPSPSVVAAAIAKGMYQMPETEAGSSVADEWTEEVSTEGLKTKIARWRSELPPEKDHEKKLLQTQTERRNGKNRRKSGGGLFSCFGNVYGFEISVSCGGKSRTKKPGRRSSSSELTINESLV